MALPHYQLTTLNSPVFSFVMDDRRKEYDLTAPYQRGSVWTEEQRRNLIKSLLIGIPIGAVTVAKQDIRSTGPYYRVVDGKQRIETLWAFVDGILSVPRDWFDHRDLDLTPMTVREWVAWDDLTPRGHRRFEGCTLGTVEFDSQSETVELAEPDAQGNRFVHRRRTPVEALAAEAELYLLINFGGVEQTAADRQRAEEVRTM